jgi:hypothetical protein
VERTTCQVFKEGVYEYSNDKGGIYFKRGYLTPGSPSSLEVHPAIAPDRPMEPSSLWVPILLWLHLPLKMGARISSNALLLSQEG